MTLAAIQKAASGGRSAVVADKPAAKTQDKGGAAKGKEKEEKKAKVPTPVSGPRKAVAAAAMGEVGKVRAKEMTGKDEKGDPARFGWRSLTEYYMVASGGSWPDPALLKYRRGGTKMQHGTGKRIEVNDTLPSWCGVFATWAVKTGGFSVKDWGPGRAAPNIMKRMNKVPQVGDVVVSPNQNHHAVVVWVEPEAADKAATGKKNSIVVKTVDGNSGSNPVSGGEVVDKGASNMSKWAWGAWSPE
jgi:hypothetical protein